MHRIGKELHYNGMGISKNSLDNTTETRNPDDYIYAGPVECFPLYSILLAINQTVVDYFSLDIEGIELRILRAIPFDLLTIKVNIDLWILDPN